MKTILLAFVTALAAIHTWAASPEIDHEKVLYVHLMEDGEVVHTLTIRDPAFLEKPAGTIVGVRGFTLRTSLVMGTGPYRIVAHLPPGLCASSFLFQLAAGANTAAHGELATLHALDACPGGRETGLIEAKLQR